MKELSDEIVNYLLQLIDIPSYEYPEGPNKAIEFINETLTRKGIKTVLVESGGLKNLVIEIGQGSPRVVINTHLDVVPESENSKCEGYVSNGKIYGRGSADAKGAAAVMLALIIELVKKENNLTKRAIFQFVSDEEVSGENGTGCLVPKYPADWCIFGEPMAGNKICYGSKAIFSQKFIFQGIPGHGSRPWEGKNAVLCAAKFINNLTSHNLFDYEKLGKEATTVTPSIIHGGTKINQIPETCELKVDIRRPATVSESEILAAVKDAMQGIDCTITQETTSIVPPVYTSPDSDLVQTLIKENEKVVGEQPTLYIATGSSDAVFYAPTGAQVVEFGPRGKNWHGPAEYVEIQGLLDWYNVLFNLLTN
jgi:succinyl-diaminopimelate desuccinylase